MKKTILKSGVLCATVFGLALSANAAVININLTGASAEYTFWNAAAGPFLVAQSCTNVQKAYDVKADGVTANKTYGIVTGTCGSDTVNIRYTSNASYDGIASQKGTDPFNKTLCIDKSQRYFANEANITLGTLAAPGTFIATDVAPTPTVACQQVTVGASDVEASTFNQESHGQLNGPYLGGYKDYVISGLDGTNLTVSHPIIVPFSFFKTIGVPTTNMTREMATQIFSGQVKNWNKFNPAWVSKPIVVCMRHAGSGTHATLDAAVMRGDALLKKLEDTTGIVGPKTYFNNGSTEEMNCIAWADAQGAGGIGYADVDQITDSVTGSVITDPAHAVNNTMHMTYEGEYGTKTNIVNGMYSFWSQQALYEDQCETLTSTSTPVRPSYCTGGDDPHGVAAGGSLHTWITNMISFASNSANIALSGKGNFWAASSEMKVVKDSDFSWPHR